mmetsp:Transcript_66825/g.159933  ORF Transcript_66825/g.159933 Transcript_66825/m.159933 type:complete len:205 (+) Transcript_66825:1150-1764(+)
MVPVAGALGGACLDCRLCFHMQVSAHRRHQTEHVATGQPNQLRIKRISPHLVLLLPSRCLWSPPLLAPVPLLRLLHGCNPGGAHSDGLPLAAAFSCLRRPVWCSVSSFHSAPTTAAGRLGVPGLDGASVSARQQHLLPSWHSDWRAVVVYAICWLLPCSDSVVAVRFGGKNAKARWRCCEGAAERTQGEWREGPCARRAAAKQQ